MYAIRSYYAVLDEINAAGYGLTLGIHSRNQQFAERAERHVRAGNTYVNRNMIGAVVGVQPFVITSYSIHYTKLYEKSRGIQDLCRRRGSH